MKELYPVAHNLKTIVNARLDDTKIELHLGQENHAARLVALDTHVNGLVEDLRRSNRNNPLALAKLDAWAKDFRAAESATANAVTRMVNEVRLIVTDLTDLLTNPRGPRGAAAGAF